MNLLYQNEHITLHTLFTEFDTKDCRGGDGRSIGAVACHSLPLVPPARNRSGHPMDDVDIDFYLDLDVDVVDNCEVLVSTSLITKISIHPNPIHL